MSVLSRMELLGVAVDPEPLVDMSREMQDELADIEREIYGSVGHEFNIGSPQQLSQVLFDELSLPKTRRTKLGYTTDAVAMDQLRGVHPAVDLVMRHRAISKLKGTYVDALPGLINPKTKRIHTTFNQTTAATGRLSSNDPNLQNIPVRTGYGNRIRNAFIARDVGKQPMLLAADYSQIELRIMAHLSQDPALIESFENDEDIHAATAANVFAVPFDEVTSEQRRRAKVFNFGVLYGLSEYGLSTKERIPREEAAAFIKRYFEKYPKVAEWRDAHDEEVQDRRLGRDADGPPPLHPRDQVAELPDPRRRRAHGHQHAGAGQRQRHHQGGDEPHRRRDCRARARLAHDPAGPRRADLRGPARRDRRDPRPLPARHAAVARHGRAAEDRHQDRQVLGRAGSRAARCCPRKKPNSAFAKNLVVSAPDECIRAYRAIAKRVVITLALGSRTSLPVDRPYVDTAVLFDGVAVAKRVVRSETNRLG